MRTALTITLAIALLATGTVAAETPATPASGGAPTEFVRTKTEAIRKILKRRPRAGTKAHAKKKRDVKHEVSTFLDFDLLAQRSLRDYWDERSETERSEFVQLLRDLVEESYLSRIDENPSFRVDYREEKILKSGKVIVRTTARQGKRTAVEVDFKLLPRERGWIVYDMVIDDVSVERNYRRQFKKIIKKDGYPHLVKRMRSKLTELRGGGQVSKPGEGADL